MKEGILPHYIIPLPKTKVKPQFKKNRTESHILHNRFRHAAAAFHRARIFLGESIYTSRLFLYDLEIRVAWRKGRCAIRKGRITMSTHYEPGDIITSFGPRNIDADIFDVIDDRNTLSVLIYFPREEWEAADEDDQLEMINEYTFPDYCIQSATWEEAAPDADAEDWQIAINATIIFDVSE